MALLPHIWLIFAVASQQTMSNPHSPGTACLSLKPEQTLGRCELGGKAKGSCCGVLIRLTAGMRRTVQARRCAAS